MPNKKKQLINNIIVIGGGRWARVITDVLLDITNPVLNILIYSPSNHTFMNEWIALKKIEKRVKTINKFPKMFETPHVVIIVNAPKDHYTSSIMALKAGLDVLVEKPVTLNYKQAIDLDNLSKKQNKTICASHVFLYASYLENFSKRIKQKGKIEKICISWQDTVVEKRHGELKNFDPGVPIILDCLPHIASIISKFTSIDFCYESIRLHISNGGSRVNIFLRNSTIPFEITIARNGFKRTRLLEIIIDKKISKIDFSIEPGEIEIENKKINGDFNWGTKTKPLKKLLLAFLHGVNSRKFDERLDFGFGVQISKLIDKSLMIYKDSQIDWIINSLKKVDYLNQDLNYAINEFNLFYELDINLKSHQKKLSAETKNKLLSKFNQLLLQNKD